MVSAVCMQKTGCRTVTQRSLVRGDRPCHAVTVVHFLIAPSSVPPAPDTQCFTSRPRSTSRSGTGTQRAWSRWIQVSVPASTCALFVICRRARPMLPSQRMTTAASPQTGRVCTAQRTRLDRSSTSSSHHRPSPPPPTRSVPICARLQPADRGLGHQQCDLVGRK